MIPATTTVDITSDHAALVMRAVERDLEQRGSSMQPADRAYLAELSVSLALLAAIHRAHAEKMA